jgi:polyisoprenoid-binding protein YceI
VPTAQTLAVRSGTYEFDEANTRIGFAARYAMVTTVRGEFTEFFGQIQLDTEDVTRCSAVITLYTESINTGQAQRDEHLRSPDFLDVETYPEIGFRSTTVAALSNGRYRMTGDLAIRGAHRPVSVDFAVTGTATDPQGHELVGFEGSTTISRGAFGLVWNAVLETGGVLVSDEVDLQFDVALSRVRSSA